MRFSGGANEILSMIFLCFLQISLADKHISSRLFSNTIHLLFSSNTVIAPSARRAFCTLSTLMKASDIYVQCAFSHALPVCFGQCNKTK